MRLLFSQLAIPILAMPLYAFANDDLCSNIPELQPYVLGGCECGKRLSKIPVTAPKGMSLIAACDYGKEEFVGTVGEFYFKGDATFSGEVRHTAGATSEGSVLFKTKTAGKLSQFSNAILSLKFGDSPIAIQKFNLPPVSEESPCWAADASIKIRLLYVKAGYDSSDEGGFPKEFEVLKVGPSRPCEIEPEPEIVD